MGNAEPKAWNNTPDGHQIQGRLTRSGKEPPRGTRCTLVVDGEVCDVFPAWQLQEDKNERRCAAHKGE